MRGRFTTPGGGAFANNPSSSHCKRGDTRRSPQRPLPYPGGSPLEGADGKHLRRAFEHHTNISHPRQVDITFRYVKVGRRPTRRSKAVRARSDKAPYRIACKRRDHALKPCRSPSVGAALARNVALPGRLIHEPRPPCSGAWLGRTGEAFNSRRIGRGGRG